MAALGAGTARLFDGCQRLLLRDAAENTPLRSVIRHIEPECRGKLATCSVLLSPPLLVLLQPRHNLLACFGGRFRMGGDTIEWANADFVAHTGTARWTIPVAVKKQRPFRTAGRRAKRGAWDGSLSGNLLGKFEVGTLDGVPPNSSYCSLIAASVDRSRSWQQASRPPCLRRKTLSATSSSGSCWSWRSAASDCSPGRRCSPTNVRRRNRNAS